MEPETTVIKGRLDEKGPRLSTCGSCKVELRRTDLAEFEELVMEFYLQNLFFLKAFKSSDDFWKKIFFGYLSIINIDCNLLYYKKYCQQNRKKPENYAPFKKLFGSIRIPARLRETCLKICRPESDGEVIYIPDLFPKTRNFLLGETFDLDPKVERNLLKYHCLVSDLHFVHIFDHPWILQRYDIEVK